MTARILVAAVLALCALLVSPVPLRGFGMVPVLVLVALDGVLIGGTGGLAFARSRTLDERQAALRDLAYRRGFRLLGAGIVAALFATLVGQGIVASVGTFRQVDSGMSGRLLVALAELMLMMPTLVLAWRSDSLPRLQGWAGVGAVPAVALVWLLAVAFAPIQAAGAGRNFSVGAEATGSTCRHFAAGQIVAGGLGATVGLRAHVCWNGRQAFVIGDRHFPTPADVRADPDDRFLTACDVDDVDDFAAVTDKACAATVHDDGTLHYAVRARVAPLHLPIGARDVRMDLVVTRDGRVLSQP